MKTFKNIAKLLKEGRESFPKRISQNELSLKLGYTNGQFISNVERGLCSVPIKKLVKLVEVLELDKTEVKKAILLDKENELDEIFSIE